LSRRLRRRLQATLAALGRHSRQAAAAIADVIGADELLLLVALTLVTVALWPLFGRQALLVPGVVGLWYALPTRAPFVTRHTAEPDKSRRKS
jgi:hypothetical protein